MSDDKNVNLNLLPIKAEAKLDVTLDVNELAKTTVDGVEKLLTGQPGKELGQFLSHYIEVAGLPGRAILGVWQFLVYSISKVAYAPKKVAPPRELLGQTLDGVKWHEEGSLHYEMFAQLLARSMDEDNGKVHPSFVNILKDMTRDEAFIIYHAHIRKIELHHELMRLHEFNNSAHSTPFFESSMSFLPGVDVSLKGLHNAVYFNMHVERLMNLGLMERLQFNQQVNMVFPHRDGSTIRREDTFTLSVFGTLFAETCIPPSKDATNEWGW